MIPKEVQQIAIECDNKYPESLDKAVDTCFAKVKKLPQFEDWLHDFARDAIRHEISDRRHHRNVAMRKKNGAYGGSAKVSAGSKSNTEVILSSVFDYAMAGTRLGDLNFSDLPAISDDQRSRSNGYIFNARLCESLYQLRPKKGDAQVKSLKESKVQSIFNGLK